MNKNIVPFEKVQPLVVESLLCADASNGGKRLVVEVKFDDKGRPSVSINVYQANSLVEGFWGLAMALECYNKL